MKAGKFRAHVSRRIPLPLMDEVKRQVEQMLKEGIIEETRSPYNSPVRLVKKPHGVTKPSKVDRCPTVAMSLDQSPLEDDCKLEIPEEDMNQPITLDSGIYEANKQMTENGKELPEIRCSSTTLYNGVEFSEENSATEPKNVLTVLQNILARNFPEFGDSFHRERVCAYLKACRRNAKKKNGEPFVRISARYLSAGMATRLAEQIYRNEKNHMESVVGYKLHANNSPEQASNESMPNSQDETIPSSVHTVPEVDTPKTTGSVCQENSSLFQPPTMMGSSSTFPILFPLPGMTERLFAKFLGQTAEFLLMVADRIEAGQSLFPPSINSALLSTFK
ncbi:unnamed protein product [Echinostoma caproni]|uniref:Retrovirus-related Pol polyprotein from transposon 17.6 n=1 Tax=Echinostoma caproni TaxID=27848 RepID=A0A183AIS6_9TREM|nr:unnamed protein product [Echinostoma caproni]